MSQNQGYSKKYGQVFLKNRNIAAYEVSLINGKAGSSVIEIGPGHGMLTGELLKANYRVIAIESDHRFVDDLEYHFTEEVREGQLQIIKDDFLKSELKSADYIAGNVPYQISSPIIEKLRTMSFGKAILMVQEEFGERLCAKQGMESYSRLSVMTSLSFDCKLERKVSRKNFTPVPKVDSVIVSLSPKPWDYGIDYETVSEVAKKLFSQRRKKISNVIGKNDFEYSQKRVEELSPDEIIRMCYSLYPEKFRSC